MTLLKTLLFTILIPGTVAGLVPALLITYLNILPRLPGGWIRIPAGVLLGIGVPIYLWCAGEFVLRGRGTPAPHDPPRALVTSGLYRLTPNPMYVGILSIVVGSSFFWNSPEVLIYAGMMAIAFHLRVVYYEEPALEHSFGDSYRRYREVVPRWLIRSH